MATIFAVGAVCAHTTWPSRSRYVGRDPEAHTSLEIKTDAKTLPGSDFHSVPISLFCNWHRWQRKIALLDTFHSGEDQTWEPTQSTRPRLAARNLLYTALVVLPPSKAGLIKQRQYYSATTRNQGAERSCRTDQGIFPSRTSPRAVQTNQSLCSSQASILRQSIRRSTGYALSVGMRLGTICSNHSRKVCQARTTEGRM